jgi:hypothetical protein
MKRLTWMTAALLLVIVAGCGGANDVPETATEPRAALPGGLFPVNEPAGAISVTKLKAGDHAGEDVVVTGRIGGQVAPFVEGRAMFTMTDLALAVCDPEAGDHCATPWDSCCETPDEIRANMVTVQVVDGEGSVLKQDLHGEHGLEPMARLTVRGNVSQQDGDVVIVDAQKIFVHDDPAITNIS